MRLIYSRVFCSHNNNDVSASLYLTSIHVFPLAAPHITIFAVFPSVQFQLDEIYENHHFHMNNLNHSHLANNCVPNPKLRRIFCSLIRYLRANGSAHNCFIFGRAHRPMPLISTSLSFTLSLLELWWKNNSLTSKVAGQNSSEMPLQSAMQAKNEVVYNLACLHIVRLCQKCILHFTVIRSAWPPPSSTASTVASKAAMATEALANQQL